MPSILTHYGFFAEIVSKIALDTVSASNENGCQEHVTNCVYSNPKNFNVRFEPKEIASENIRCTLDTKEDFQAIETVFDESDEDDDNVEMSFPVTIVLRDHSEVVVNSRSEMVEYRSSCKGEDEADDDIECVDFKYPISYSVFNSDKSLLNTIKIQNDREMYRFIHNLTKNDIVKESFGM